MAITIEVVRRKLAEIVAERRLRKTACWPLLQEATARSNSTGCGYADYWLLYDAVRRYRPREVLELGCGISTVVLGCAAREFGGRVTSMEESENWYRKALEIVPKDLPVELVLSDTVEDTFSIFRGVRYRNVPDRPYELVFVDGPSYKTKDGDIAFDFDLIRVISKSDVPIRALIDKRVSTAFVLQRLLPGKVRYVKHLGVTFVGPVMRNDLRGIDHVTPSTSFRLGRTIEFRGVR